MAARLQRGREPQTRLAVLSCVISLDSHGMNVDCSRVDVVAANQQQQAAEPFSSVASCRHNEWEKKTNYELAARVPLVISCPWLAASVGQKTHVLAE